MIDEVDIKTKWFLNKTSCI